MSGLYHKSSLSQFTQLYQLSFTFISTVILKEGSSICWGLLEGLVNVKGLEASGLCGGLGSGGCCGLNDKGTLLP